LGWLGRAGPGAQTRPKSPNNRECNWHVRTKPVVYGSMWSPKASFISSNWALFAPLWNWHGPAQPSPSQPQTCSAADWPGRTPQSQPRRRGCGSVESEDDDQPEMRSETVAPSTRRRSWGTLGSLPTISPRTQDLSLPFRSVLCCVDINCS